MNKSSILILTICLFCFKCFYVIAKEEIPDQYKKLIIAKWFGNEKTFNAMMSLKVNDVYINQLKEINADTFSLLSIKKMFILDISDFNLVKSRRVLIIDFKGKEHYLRAKNDVFAFVRKNYDSKKYGAHFIFVVLLFLKSARGYDFIVDQAEKLFYNTLLKKYPNILKNRNCLLMKRNEKTIICESLFSTLGGDSLILIEIEMNPNTISITKKREEILKHYM